jgi:NMD protein affecting ribosome stability and mRNA decay
VKPAGTRAGGKEQVRELLTRRARAHQAPAPKLTGAPPADLTVCERCGDVFWRKTWRRSPVRVTHALLARAAWSVCPACQQVDTGQYFGRVVLRGTYMAANEQGIRRRIRNVEQWAGHTQPQRRIVSIRRAAGGLEVLTTSQKLAHRIVHELKKAFRGRATYSWSDRHRRLYAVWEREEAAVPPAG